MFVYIDDKNLFSGTRCLDYDSLVYLIGIKPMNLFDYKHLLSDRSHIRIKLLVISKLSTAEIFDAWDLLSQSMLIALSYKNKSFEVLDKLLEFNDVDIERNLLTRFFDRYCDRLKTSFHVETRIHANKKPT